jgi:hypothetical protein
VGIAFRVWVARLIGVMMRLDVRRTARQQDAVERVQHCVEFESIFEDGNQQWRTASRVGDGGYVFLAHHVERVWRDNLSIAGDTD